MARAHYWSYLLNEEGQPIPSADIYVYIANSLVLADVYDAESGGTVISTGPQVSTNTNGLFEFWIGDTTDSNGYEPGTKFKLKWLKTGVITDDGTNLIDNVDIDLVINKSQVYTITIETLGWSGPDAIGYYADVQHKFAKKYPLVICYNDSSSLSEMIIASAIDLETTRVYKGNNSRAHVTVIG